MCLYIYTIILTYIYPTSTITHRHLSMWFMVNKLSLINATKRKTQLKQIISCLLLIANDHLLYKGNTMNNIPISQVASAKFLGRPLHRPFSYRETHQNNNISTKIAQI